METTRRRADSSASGLREEIDRLRQQLIERERLASVGLLISDIGHEIRNPLAWVKLNEGLLLMMAEQARKTGDAQKLLAELPKLVQLLKDNEEGLNRIEHVLDALRLMSRRQSEPVAPHDLNEICQRTLVMLNQAFKKKGIALLTEWGALPPVACKGNDVAQAVMNLLVNAADAVPNGGHVGIRTSLLGTEALIEVSDDGPGIPRRDAARIFEPFYTTKPLGTGLGLPLVRSVAQDHGGRTEVGKSASGGATFRMWLLLAPRTAAAP